LSEVMGKYADEQIRSRAWNVRSQTEELSVLSNLTDFLGDIYIQDLDSQKLRDFKEALIKLPAYRNTTGVTKGLSFLELIELRGVRTLSEKRINHILSVVRAFLGYAVRYDYIPKNYAAGMLSKEKTRAEDEKEVFSEEDLKAIFSSSSYTGVSPKNSWNYWLPLLGYFTGARIEELCQLEVEDIKIVDGIPVIDINDNGEKRLKNSSSRRVIPIHPTLVKALGFLGYVETVRKAGEIRLFPGLRKIQHRLSHAPSQWFSRLKGKLGIEGKKSFHSFRHTFANNLKQAEASGQAVKELMGHARSDESKDRYGKSYIPKILLKALMKIPLPPVPGV
jgi:integrase